MAESKESRFYITLVTLVLVALFGSWFLHSIFSDQAGWRDAEFDTAVSRFDYNIMLARVEWMRKGQPTDVFLSLTEGDQEDNPNEEINGTIRVLMSRTGWPMARSQGVNGCFELWHLLGHREKLNQELTVQFESVEQRALCRFYYDGKESFQFYPESGQVKKLY